MKAAFCAVMATVVAAVVGIAAAYAYWSLAANAQWAASIAALSIWCAAVTVLVTIGIVDICKGRVIP